MKNNFIGRVESDLKESRINWKVMILFIPISFFTFIFHEFGHWTFGEILGNDMAINLNNSTPKNGHFIRESHALWSAIGGPLFTIILSFLFLIITRFTQSIYTYSVTFFAVFSRFFSIIFGGINLQDEAKIASILNTNQYLVALVVLTTLALILWKSSSLMNLNLKAVGYFTILSVFSILIVIGTNHFL